MSYKKYLAVLSFLFLFLLSSCSEALTLEVESTIELASIEVQRDTSFEELDLVTSVDVTLEDGSTRPLFVDWTKAMDSYDTSKSSLELEGILLLDDDVKNTKNIKVLQDITFEAESIEKTIALHEDYSIFYDLVDALDQTAILEDSDTSYTVFIPNNQAFTEALALLDMTLDDLLNDQVLLSQIIDNHIVSEPYSSPILKASAPITIINENDSELDVTLVGNQLYINTFTQAKLASYEVTNGFIYEIDKVLLPSVPGIGGEELFSDDILSLFVLALYSSDLLIDVLSQDGVTVFVPDETAFLNLASSLGIEETDVENIESNEEFTMEDLTESEELNNLLLNHIVVGAYLAEDLYIGAPTSVYSLAGNELEVLVVDGQLTIAGAVVTASKVDQQFGVVYTIDQVLLTPEVIELIEENIEN